MRPHDIVVRLHELGVSLEIDDLPLVEHLHVAVDEVPSQFVKAIRRMQPGTITIPMTQMTVDDINVLLGLPNLVDICAHGLPFAAELFATRLPFHRLRSIAMSNTDLGDNDVTILRGRNNLTSLHFSSTHLTDDALRTFGTLDSLELLDLQHTRISDHGLMHLTNLRSLFTVDAKGSLVTPRGANAFRQHVAPWLPDLEVLL